MNSQFVVNEIIDYTRLQQLAWQRGNPGFYTYSKGSRFELYNTGYHIQLSVIWGDDYWQWYAIVDDRENGPVHRLMFIVQMLFNIQLN